MSAQALQKMLIRVLFDPTLLNQLKSNPNTVMGIAELTRDELADLLAQDPRAYQTDPHRSSRHLQALIEEYPVAVHHHTQGTPGRLLSFFSSPQFHQAIVEWTSLRAAFETYLLEDSAAELHPLIHLESIMAHCRNADSGPPLEKGYWKLCPAVALMEAPVGLATQYGALFGALQGGHILEALQTPPQQNFSPSGAELTWILAEKTETGDVQLGEIPGSLAAILQRVSQEAVAESHLVKIVVSLGADTEEEALEVLESLQEDGLIVRGA